MKSPFDNKYVFFVMALFIAAFLGHDLEAKNWWWAALEAAVTAGNIYIFSYRAKDWSNAE